MAAASLSRFSLWLWSGKEKNCVSKGSSLKISSADSIKLFPKKRRVEKQSGEAVLVGGSEGGILFSGSESDGPDWSIGWVEPHGIDFSSDDDGFAVLVPCYSSGCKELVDNSNNQLLSAMKNLPIEFSSAEGKKGMEWLSSVENF